MHQGLIIPELVERRAGESCNIECPSVEGRILFSSQLDHSKQTVRATALTSAYWIFKRLWAQNSVYEREFRAYYERFLVDQMGSTKKKSRI